MTVFYLHILIAFGCLMGAAGVALGFVGRRRPPDLTPPLSPPRSSR